MVCPAARAPPSARIDVRWSNVVWGPTPAPPSAQLVPGGYKSASRAWPLAVLALRRTFCFSMNRPAARIRWPAAGVCWAHYAPGRTRRTIIVTTHSGGGGYATQIAIMDVGRVSRANPAQMRSWAGPKLDDPPGMMPSSPIRRAES